MTERLRRFAALITQETYRALQTAALSSGRDHADILRDVMHAWALGGQVAGVPSLLSPEQTAQLLGVTADTVRDWARLGVIPARKIGRVWRFDADELKGAGRFTAPAPVSAPDARIGGSALQSAVEKFAKRQARKAADRQQRKERVRDKAAGGARAPWGSSPRARGRFAE